MSDIFTLQGKGLTLANTAANTQTKKTRLLNSSFSDVILDEAKNSINQKDYYYHIPCKPEKVKVPFRVTDMNISDLSE